MTGPSEPESDLDLTALARVGTRAQLGETLVAGEWLGAVREATRKGNVGWLTDLEALLTDPESRSRYFLDPTLMLFAAGVPAGDASGGPLVFADAAAATVSIGLDQLDQSRPGASRGFFASLGWHTIGPGGLDAPDPAGYWAAVFSRAGIHQKGRAKQRCFPVSTGECFTISIAKASAGTPGLWPHPEMAWFTADEAVFSALQAAWHELPRRLRARPMLWRIAEPGIARLPLSGPSLHAAAADAALAFRGRYRITREARPGNSVWLTGTDLPTFASGTDLTGKASNLGEDRTLVVVGPLAGAAFEHDRRIIGVPRVSQARRYTTRWRRIPMAVVLAAALIGLMVGFVAVRLGNPQVILSGTVVCESGQPVVGIWVDAPAGGSGFASWRTRVGADNMAIYSRRINIGRPVTLHIGCGGTPADWGSSNWTPAVTLTTKASAINALCEKGIGPGVRCRPS